MAMHIGHVALRVTHIDQSAKHAVDVLGLRETARSPQEVLLTANEKHHELQLIAADRAGLDHVGLEVESEEELEQVRTRILGSGARLLEDVPHEAGLGSALRALGPADVVYEVYCEMERIRSLWPRFSGHRSANLAISPFSVKVTLR